MTVIRDAGAGSGLCGMTKRRGAVLEFRMNGDMLELELPEVPEETPDDDAGDWAEKLSPSYAGALFEAVYLYPDDGCRWALRALYELHHGYLSVWLGGRRGVWRAYVDYLYHVACVYVDFLWKLCPKEKERLEGSEEYGRYALAVEVRDWLAQF